MGTQSQPDPHGPVFISYRHQDGSGIADRVQRRARAMGLPVWRDKNDMLNGSLAQRMLEAIRGGISAAIVIVTPAVADSRAILDVEFPQIARLARNEHLTILMVNDIRLGDGNLDPEGPHHVLGDGHGINVKDVMWVDGRGDDIDRRLRMLARERVRAGHLARGERLRVSIGTRNPSQATDHVRADLDLRFEAGQVPGIIEPEVIDDLGLTAAAVRDAYDAVTAKGWDISGNAHLSIAMALGAMLPATICPHVVFRQPNGEEWAGSGSVIGLPPAPALAVTEPAGARIVGARPALAVVDLLPRPDNTAWSKICSNPDGWSGVRYLRPAQPGALNPDHADPLALEVAYHLKDLAAERGTSEVHVLYGGPAPLAVLVGRLLNALRVTVYEYARSDGGSRYVPTLRVAPGAAVTAIDRPI